MKYLIALILAFSFSINSFAVCQKTTQVLTASVMTADRTSTVINMQRQELVAVFSIWSGTPVGNLIIQGSLDNVNYFPLDTVAAGAGAGTDLFEIANSAVKFIRMFYDFTSSTGVLNTWISVKGTGC